MFPPKRWFLDDQHGATSQKTAFFIVTAVKISNDTKVYLFWSVWWNIKKIYGAVVSNQGPIIKTAMIWVSKIIKWMTRCKAFEREERQLGNCEVTTQALRHIAKSLMKRNGPQTTFQEHLEITYHSEGKSNATGGLFRKPHHISWPVWLKLWTKDEDCSLNCAEMCRRQSGGKNMIFHFKAIPLTGLAGL
jgi:hypothetical protein